MSRELTEKQREFCRLVAGGQSARGAYAAAFKVSEASAGPSASRMLKRDNIRAEVNRLQAAARELSRRRDAEAVGDSAERMEMLWRMARESEEAGNVEDAVKCIKELNRMDGSREPERLEVREVKLSFEHIMQEVRESAERSKINVSKEDGLGQN